MSRRTGRSGRSSAQRGQRHAFSGSEDPRQMLSMAYGLHQNGQLSRARTLYEQILTLEPKNADALQFLGLLYFQTGDASRARDLIEQAIRERPDIASYHDNLGTVLETLGELEAALEAYGRAAALEPEVADRSFNNGVVLERLGRFEEAEQSYRQAIEAAPGDGDYHFNLGNVLKAQGRFSDAVQSYRQALSLKPESGEVCNNLGNALLLSGDAQGAVKVLRQALDKGPGDPLLHNNLGNALRDLGDLIAAAKSYRRALEIDPQYEQSHRNLGGTLLQAGALGESAQVFLKALSRFPHSTEIRKGFIAAVRHLLPDSHRPDLADALASCMADADTPPQQLARVIARVLCLKHELLPGDDFNPAAAAKALAGDPLALTLLRRTINVDSGLERVLTGVRRWLLLDHGAAASRLPAEWLELSCALALQCFNNEFVFAESAEEIRLAEECKSLVESTDGMAETDRLVERLVLVALYRPLSTLACAERLAARTDWPGPLVELVDRALRDPLQEARIEATIPAVTAIRDAVSIEVKTQYESNPYPRWLDVARVAPQSYADALKRSYPHFRPASRLEGPNEVLVAGCGTGLEAINAAVSRTGARVTGVDLSRASLAYAKWMARKLGLDNIQFLQGDLLDLKSLNRSFDVIECSGVLHHLADPMSGWRVLVDCLAPGGVMKIGLYSELARAQVVNARKAIRAAGYGSEPDGIRAIRQKIFEASENDPLAELAFSEDLYTTSACRDLLFHVCEHRFRLGELGNALELLGIEFIGFELPHPSVRTLYRGFNPADGDMTDLEAWSRFESKHPDTFAAMYVFWCHKPGEDTRC